MAAGLSSYVVASAAAAVAATGAVVAWAATTARPAPADPPVTLSKLPNRPAEIRGLAAALIAAVVVFAVPPSNQVESVQEVSAVLLLAAAALRWYRLTRPGPAVLDRLTQVLALVPACGLFGGACVVALYDGLDELDWWGPWLGSLVLGGALALVAGLSWRQQPTQPR
ncbi:hypothetical protein GCM10009827_057730 [Dactylosporangium maewongense]|uniref:Uncharacterized protein n=1 Tax=Dactylosporangium maewongense TaxID=634393 RepID=A0ABP4LVE9_9ACTN